MTADKYQLFASAATAKVRSHVWKYAAGSIGSSPASRPDPIFESMPLPPHPIQRHPMYPTFTRPIQRHPTPATSQPVPVLQIVALAVIEDRLGWDGVGWGWEGWGGVGWDGMGWDGDGVGWVGWDGIG